MDGYSEPGSFAPSIQFRQIAGNLFPSLGMWAAIAGLFILNLAWLGLSERVTADHSWMISTWPVALFSATFLTYLQFRARCSRFLQMALKTTMMISFAGTSLGALRIFNHLVNTLALPLVDERLHQWDMFLGLDWMSYVQWMADRPNLSWLLGMSYDTIYFAIFIIAVYHIVSQRDDRAIEICSLLVGTALVCSAIGALFPAYGAMETLGSPELLNKLRSGAGVYAVQALTDVRSPGLVFLNSTNLPGLTTFPSYHTALGVLCIYSCRHHPVALAAASIYATVMIASTPVYGGHYFTDVIAGGLFTIVYILAWRRLAAIAVDLNWPGMRVRIPGFQCANGSTAIAT